MACACSMRRMISRSPDGAAHAREQLHLLEGLGEEVVRAGVERRDHVLDRGVRRERRSPAAWPCDVGAQAAADLEPVEARQGQVEEDQVGLVLADDAEPVLAIRDGDDMVPGAPRTV